MNNFIREYAGSVRGVLSGFDRLVLRGSLRSPAFQLGIMGYLWRKQVLLKDYAKHAEQTTALLKEGSLAKAHKLGREIRYLPSSQTSKEDVAREIARRDGITDGLIGVLSCVEPCSSFEIFRNRDTYRLELRPRLRKCLHLYHYYMHPTFGFMHARLQTWFPFNIQVCLNGREWLARQMDRAGLAYRQRDNSFTWLEDVDKAQALMNQQSAAPWPRLLQGIVRDIHPRHARIFERSPLINYRWSVHQSEWASDVLFRSRAALEAVYPRLIHHAITTFGSVDVMRFLGHKLTETGQIPSRFAGEVKTDVRERAEGIRIKHWVDDNSLKLYDKWSVLRPEFTMNHPSAFQVFRPKEGEPDGPCAWRPLRQSIEDLPRRAALCQAANERYLEALASVTDETPLKQWAEPLCQPVPVVSSQPARRSKNQTKPKTKLSPKPKPPRDESVPSIPWLRPMRHCSRRWHASNTWPIVSATATCANSCLPTNPKMTENGAAVPRRSAESSCCCALTVSFKRSSTPTATCSPPTADKSSPACSRHATRAPKC